MANFITNSAQHDLKNRLVELIKNSQELKFLVGFFYFSGIRELYEGLKENNNYALKVLVGLNVDQVNCGLIEIADDTKMSDDEKTYHFLESIKKSISTENFDTPDFYDQINYFISLLEQGKLQIRKTYNPNHAKIYIFKLDDKQVGRKELFITGSSNLTRAGLGTQEEFNVEISDYGFKDAEQYFDTLWDDAVKITEVDERKNRLIETVKTQTLVKEVTPFEAYCLLLKTYLDARGKQEIGQSLIDTLIKHDYKPYKYQLDAVSEALQMIQDYNGVLIADVVGLGKTIIACTVGRELKKRGLIICPPGLIGDRNKKSGWKKYAEEFGLHSWEIRSLGDLESTLEFAQTANDIEVVIVDEAHRFRNQDTQDYEYLKNICRGRQVILLTATPFNNKPSDILSLLNLFITPKKSAITLDSNLLDQFKSFRGIYDRLSYIKKYYNSKQSDKKTKALNYYKGLFEEDNFDTQKVAGRARYLAAQIRNVIEPVTIRRNRLDLKNHPEYKEEVKDLSEVKDPKEWFFNLTPKQLDFYTEVIEHYFGDPENGGRFKGAIYRPFEYEKGLKGIEQIAAGEKLSQEDNRQFNQQRNLFDFMRRLLVKRFESSFGSFEQSIKNFKRVTEQAKQFIDRTGEYILDRKLLEKIYDLDAEEIESALLAYEERIKNGEYPKNHKRYKFTGATLNEFKSDIESDLKLYDEILEHLKTLDLVKNDPKSVCLIENLEKELNTAPAAGEPKRKVIIFSEYVDTVLYLEKALKTKFGSRLLVVAGDLPISKISEINNNFDASSKTPEDDYDILLTSDKISEGYNLNRAGVVVNYDIPWNPVRVIQRVGRINRISKKVFNDLFIVNFFPTEIGAELVRSREIAANKMFLIHSTLGEDAKIFEIDEEPSPSGLYQRLTQNPESGEKESFYTRAYREYTKIKNEHPDLINQLENYPPRIKTAKEAKANELFVFFRKGRLYATNVKINNKGMFPQPITFEEVYEKVKCAPVEPRLEWNSDEFWQAYRSAQEYKEYQLGPVSEATLEQRALNNLDTLIAHENASLLPLKNFMRILKEDILSYGTLPEYTLRRIANFKPDKPNEIEELKREIGGNYLIKEKARIKEQKKELIIAVYNKLK